MPAPLIVLWLATTDMSETQRRAVDGWAQAAGTATRLAPRAPENIPYPSDIVDEIEMSLEEARTLPATDAAAVLQRARTLLFDHPEVPQAAWLLAELEALDSRTGLSTAPSPRQGGAAGGAAAPAAGGGEPPDAASADLDLPPLRGDDELYVDGALRPAVDRLGSGRHHLRLLRDGATLFSVWLAGQREAESPDRAAKLASLRALLAPCSGADLMGVDTTPDRAIPAPGTSCPHWLVARPSLDGGARLAECRRDRCGPWSAQPTAAASAAEPRPGPDGWPSWATWTLVGAGVVAAGAAALWATDALQREPPETTFVFTGPGADGLMRF